ncbi:NifU N-terminal domain-containing protein [Pontibacillus litoralis]|uniref:Scaffold protein Nfu/NifU n=1 Tax=Pontibacillus litoralis JSM 072002 TaxID=1385512 RepID=A0A0A5HVU3_9BACI|nr:NifU N-terminal domain-containing protein [Pontibacillus litoralis]KGX87762.1 Scaffold protein Nfu/NifU [Pontibacillus litoralis JSM 072002]
MTIQAQPTPNPNAYKFTSDRIIFGGDGSISVMAGQTSEHSIMNDIMAIEGVDNVFGYQNFITVNKKADADWETLAGDVQSVIEGHGF